MEIGFKKIYVDYSFESGSVLNDVNLWQASDIWYNLQRKSPTPPGTAIPDVNPLTQHWMKVNLTHIGKWQSKIRINSRCWSLMASVAHPMTKARPWSACPCHVASKGPYSFLARNMYNTGADEVPYDAHA